MEIYLDENSWKMKGKPELSLPISGSSSGRNTSQTVTAKDITCGDSPQPLTPSKPTLQQQQQPAISAVTAAAPANFSAAAMASKPDPADGIVTGPVLLVGADGYVTKRSVEKWDWSPCMKLNFVNKITGEPTYRSFFIILN